MPGDGLPVVQRRLALATKRTVQGAGGLRVCEAETGLSDTHLSRFCSTEQRDSISIRDAVRLDALCIEEGAPHILSAMASVLGCVVFRLPEAVTEDRELQRAVVDLACEFGRVASAVSDSLSSSSDGGTELTWREAEALLSRLAGLEQITARIRHYAEQRARRPEAEAPS